MKRFYIFTLLIDLVVSISLFAQPSETNLKAQQKLNRLSHNFFIENKGQWPKEVRYLAKIGGMNAWITNNGVVYDYYQISGNHKPEEKLNLPSKAKDKIERNITSIKGQVINILLENANTEAQVLPSGLQQSYYNYFIGNDTTKWASNIKLYSDILIQDIYPGIDMHYYFDQGLIRYDYIAKSGTDLSQINLKIMGSDGYVIDKKGELLLKTCLGNITHGKLYAYQQAGNQKNEITCSFTKHKNGKIGVLAENYNPAYKLVIDPLIYSTFIGGNSFDQSFSMGIDGNGNAILTGQTFSSNYPTTSGSYNRTYNNNSDIFITKLNTTGSSLIYSSFIGGSSQDYGQSIAVDKSGNSYITGYTKSNDYPTTSGAFNRTYNGNTETFVTKLNASGSTLVYSTYLGGSADDVGFSIVVDISGNAFITGYTSSTNYPTTTGAYNVNSNGSSDAFVTKLNSSGSALVYSTYIGGNGNDVGCSMALDASGNAFITGYTNSSNFPTTSGAYNVNYNGGNYDVFVTKLNSSGSALVYSTYIGGNNQDLGYSIAIDSKGNAYITGYTVSSNYPTTKGAYDINYNGGSYDAFITKLNTSGSALIYSTIIGGSGDDIGWSITTDSIGNAYLTGETTSNNFPTTQGAYDTTFNGTGSINKGDVFVTKLNSNGSALLYSTYIGGSGDENGFSIVLGDSGSVFIAGYTTSSNFPVTKGAYDIIQNGSADVFVLKFKPVNTEITTNDVISHSVCAGSNINVSFVAGGTFNSGNVFIAQLSSSSGSFSNPTNIGTLSSSASGTINSSIPKTVIYGTGYRIKVVSTSPVQIGMDNGVDITINPLPIPDFAIKDTAQCFKGNNFVFTNNSIGTGSTNYIWKFGDNSISTSALSPFSHTYTSTGAFSITLIASDNKGCKDSITRNIYVIQSPVSSFTTTDTSECFNGNNFIFFNSSIGASSYLWEFGDNITSTCPLNPVLHSYNSTGTLSAKLISINKYNCKDSIIKNLYVRPAPLTGFVPNDTSQCLLNNYFKFDNTTTINSGMFTSLWGFGDNTTSSIFSPSHSYSKINTFQVKLITTSDFGCKDSITKNIYIRPYPIAGFSIVSDTSQCLGHNLFKFRNSTTISSGSFNSLWKFGDNGTSTINSPSYSYLTDGTFFVELIATSIYGCKDSINSSNAYVIPGPVAGFTPSDTAECFTASGSLFSFNNNSSIVAGSYSYIWKFGDGMTTNSTFSPSHIYNNTGNYNVKLLIFQDNCIDSIMEIIHISPYPKATFSLNDTIECQGSSFIATNNSTISFGTFISLWEFGDKLTSKVSSPIHAYTKAGSYNMKLVVSSFYGGCKDSMNKHITVRPGPVVNLGKDTTIKDNQLLQLDAGPGFDSYLWSNNDTTRTIIINKGYGLGKKLYWVKVTKNGCDAYDSIYVTIIPSVSINSMTSEFDILVYPNPTNDVLNISINGQGNDIIIELTNMYGEVIKVLKVNGNQNNISRSLNISELAKGVYFLNIRDNKTGKVVKIVKY